nr:hypothetical protein CFP56_10804 [Quercus suber]
MERPNQAPNSAKKAPVGNKNDRDKRDHSNTQAAAPHSPPLSNCDSGEERQNRSETVTLEEHQNSLQSVTCNNSPMAARSNGLQLAKSIYSDPLNPQITELHINEISRALNQFESKKNSTILVTLQPFLLRNQGHVHPWRILLQSQPQ